MRLPNELYEQIRERLDEMNRLEAQVARLAKAAGFDQIREDPNQPGRWIMCVVQPDGTTEFISLDDYVASLRTALRMRIADDEKRAGEEAAAAVAALKDAEEHGTIPWEDLKAQLGL